MTLMAVGGIKTEYLELGPAPLGTRVHVSAAARR